MKSNNKNISSLFRNMGSVPILKICVLLLFVLLPLTSAEGAMSDYCVTPPFLAQSIPPNVLIVLDNSGSMCGQAYAGSYDPTQFASGYYYGYFDATKNYKYTNNGRWEETTDAMTTGTTSNPIASGNFLNWATMRRVEVAKKVLTGGKGNPRSWNGSVTVKLDGENTGDCKSDWDFQKDFDTTGLNLIYPFEGNHRFTRTNGDDLNISPISGGSNTFYTYPTSDISVPAGWTVTGAASAYEAVDEASSDGNSTYIQNYNTTSPVILGYTYTQAEPAGPITVRVKVRAKTTDSGSARKIRGVLRMDKANYESNTSNLYTSYSRYSFTWTTNPVTGAPWTWNEIKAIAGSGNLQGFGVKADAGYTSSYPRVTQVYLTIPSGGPYNTIIDMGPGKDATGIIDTLTGDVRLGLAYYNHYREGAYVKTYVDFGATTSMQTSIDNMEPDTWTPLAETLYEVTRYFSQEDPYYSNSPADYQKGSVQIGYDPYWYKYSTLDSSLTDMYVPCAKSFVLMLTDGESNLDRSIPGSSTSSPYAPCSLTNIKACSGYGGSPNNPNPRFAGTTIGTTYSSSGTDYLIDAAYWARTNDMRPGSETDVPTTWRQSIPGTQNVTLYSVYMFGRGSTLLKDAAVYGGFNDLNGNNKPDCTTIAAECYRDTDGDGVVRSDGTDDPLTYYEGDDGYALETNIRSAISAILKRASSGTAASVLASGEGSGANIVQAIFYPKRTFDTTDIDWTTTLQNLWYYLDPQLGSSTIREDTDSDKELELEKDDIVHFAFDATEQKTKASRYASDAYGTEGALIDTLDSENLHYLWEAGSILQSRNIGTDPRTIYTTTDGSTLTSNFTTGNAGTFQSLLQAADLTNAQNIISYVRGDSDVDTSLYRARTVTNGGTTAIWRLGDIINSTPRITSWIPLNNYSDTTYSSFLSSDSYKNRGKVISGITYGSGMVFAGGNDGMLHAFNLGGFNVVQDGSSKKATLTGSNLGREEWAFIPKNTLPYLKYLMDQNYCHLFYIDATPFVFDASIKIDLDTDDNGIDDQPLTECQSASYSNYWECEKSKDSWRTVLIGGMRLGGACKATTYAGSQGVKIPAAGEGYSSYFALDITNPSSPTLLWEFSHPDLGYSTTGPAVMRINARTVSGTASSPDRNKNGRWFVVFASGPTGPIDTTAHQFKAYSDQNLKLFVLDLKTGQIATTVSGTPTPIDTGIPYAFGGFLNNAAIDYDLDYQDDALYMGYTNSEDASPGASTRWTQGGVIRLITREDLTGDNVDVVSGNTALNPNNWLWSYVAKDVGAVTSSVAHLAHYPVNVTSPDKAYLFFGTGRYFYKTSEVDNANVQRSLFGIKEPCLDKIKTITTTSSPVCDGANTVCSLPTAGDLVDSGSHACIYDVTVDTAITTDPDGWYLNLDASAGTSFAERNITDPLATTIGAVFFTTYAPNSGICTYGGNTYLWGLKYDTGGSINGILQGTALMQVSTGAIEEINLGTAFTDKTAGGRSGEGRRSGSLTGAPPTGQGLSLIVPPSPLKKMLHMRKK